MILPNPHRHLHWDHPAPGHYHVLPRLPAFFPEPWTPFSTQQLEGFLLQNQITSLHCLKPANGSLLHLEINPNSLQDQQNLASPSLSIIMSYLFAHVITKFQTHCQVLTDLLVFAHAVPPTGKLFSSPSHDWPPPFHPQISVQLSPPLRGLPSLKW